MSSKYIKQKGSQEPQLSRKERKRLEEERKLGHPIDQEEEEIIDVSKTEQYIENNYPKLLMGLAALVLIAGAFILFAQSGKGKQQKAATAVAQAQDAFAAQNWTLALEGDENQLGFEQVIEKYGKTRVGNLSNYYAGISNLKLGNFEDAVADLKQYNATKDPNINGLAYMNLADALSELGKNDEALGFYKKAANTKSEAFQGDFLFRYALAQINAEDFDGAKATFNQLTKEFPKSPLATEAEQYLAGL